ncbi:MAG: beta-propeller domain-containing protein [Sphingosinicella sp.]|uniref:beta-propeller domain-containing protein n=1 Tax=Sphingosinicella sp. TaxID=1917971 RepID=UPI004037B2B5
MVVSEQEIELQQANVAEEVVRDLPGAEASIMVTGTQVRNPNITNTQEANVDEGGIVKVIGEHLVVLRRGRLFTVSLAGGSMRPVDSIYAFPPGVSGEGDWYDEMLVSGDLIVVVGYSYDRGGTEINRFRMSPDGRLRFQDAWHLRSNDYYSSRNYASRLIGNRLIFYTPLYLEWEDDPLEALPGLRKWEGPGRDRPFRRIARPNQIFIVPGMRRISGSEEIEIDTLHSVTTCDLAAEQLDCSAVGVLGPESHTFYVSAGAVYLWVHDFWWSDGRSRFPDAFLYRLPLGRERPSAIGARGAPVDQFAFREDTVDGILNVLVREEGGGDAMGSPEVSGGRIALLRLPIAEFGDGQSSAASSRYRRLPSLPGSSWSFRNRFVGDHLLYGGGRFGEGEREAPVVIAPVRGGPPTTLNLRHAVERIDAIGRDAIVIGGDADENLGFTAVELPRASRPALGDLFLLPSASEGETRSHAFFFRPSSPDGASGLLGLPIRREVAPAYRRFFGSAAAMLFLRRDDRRFARAGELAAEVRGVTDDGCQASCVDWYGNARPIFLGNRIFALLGYELVEGRLARGAVSEIGRISFAPPAASRDGQAQQP